MMEHLQALDDITRVLSSYAGRDKALRSLSFLLTLRAQTSPRKDLVLALAKQCSAARLVLRQFNHPSMLKSCQQLLQTKPSDPVDYACSATVTGVYTVYGVVELLAWLSDAKLVAMDAARLWRWCLYLWLTALVAGIIRQIRLIAKKGLEKASDEVLTLTALASDFMAGVNSLPQKFLWAGKLSPSQSATLSLIASLIGLYRVF
ncbi:hypothetical protein Q1695_009865 [Nippostrongylus brasiliensis]|nr:hypothetical protein Q1695_009865 [Nippostrongylus brasiliensis]